MSSHHNVAAAAGERLEQTIAAAMTSPALRSRLLADPRAVLAEAGLVLPDHVAVRAEDTTPEEAPEVLRRSTADHIVLPVPHPPADALTDAQLDGVVGGADHQRVFDDLKGFGQGIVAMLNPGSDKFFLKIIARTPIA